MKFRKMLNKQNEVANRPNKHLHYNRFKSEYENLSIAELSPEQVLKGAK